MDIHVLSLYPEMFQPFLNGTIFRKAQEKGLFSCQLHQIRDYATDKHRSVDAKPFGGGPGMVLRYDVLYRGWSSIQEKNPQKKMHTILPSPRGKLFSQETAKRLLSTAEEKNLLLICGRFEGVDERFVEECVDEEISLGDFILTGGEIATMTILDATLRLIPQCLGNDYSNKEESFSPELASQLEYPQYTAPRIFRGREVPEIILSGNHKKIEEWRKKESKRITQRYRPDILKNTRSHREFSHEEE